MKISLLVAVFIEMGFSMAIGQEVNFETRSPDKRLSIQVNHLKSENTSKVTYQVTYDQKTVVLASNLGIESGNADWTKDVIVELESQKLQDTTWYPVYGERSEIPDKYNETVISITKADNPRKVLHLVVRAYDEGAAFRYCFPEHENGGEYLHVTNEHTNFVMPEGTKGYFAAWAQATYDLLPLDEFPGECERPLTLVLPNGLYASLTEAEMVNYSRTKFIVEKGNPDTIKCSMYSAVDEITPFFTPWRVIMVAEKPGDLIENNYLILNLNPPNQIENTSWIKPGKVMREVQLSTPAGKKLVDFASEHNFQYIEFDAGWYGYEYTVESDASTVSVDPRRNPANNLDLMEVIRYAKSKNIGVWVYVNQRELACQLDKILPLYQKWGLKGVKYGFVQVGSHRWTTWMHDAVKKAAKYELMVDIHDEYRPTGFSRTYPNLLTQEGIRGNEAFPDATYNTTLPFTRYIAGAGDYTICYYRQAFDDKSKEDSHGVPRSKVIKTTSAHQLSLAVICYSPLQFIFWYDVPSDYHGEPEIEFFEKVPTVWDETKVIHGAPGQYITIARKKGDEWFVGTITNNDARTLNVPLHFLEEGKAYEASIYYDDPKAKTRTKVGIKRIKVDSSEEIKAELKSSGGQAIWIKPIGK